MLSLDFFRRKSAPNARTRSLHFDRLESRALLATIEPTISATLEPAVDLSLAAETDNAENYFTDSDSYTPQEPSQSAGAPTITWLSWEMDGSTFVFYGSVIDDKPVTQITVFFGGLVNECTGVQAGGYFTIEVTWGTQAGEVTAQARDGDGLWSNIASVWAG